MRVTAGVTSEGRGCDTRMAVLQVRTCSDWMFACPLTANTSCFESGLQHAATTGAGLFQGSLCHVLTSQILGRMRRMDARSPSTVVTRQQGMQRRRKRKGNCGGVTHNAHHRPESLSAAGSKQTLPVGGPREERDKLFPTQFGACFARHILRATPSRVRNELQPTRQSARELCKRVAVPRQGWTLWSGTRLQGRSHRDSSTAR